MAAVSSSKKARKIQHPDAPRGARIAGKLLFGCGIGIWMLAAINVVTANNGRPMTRQQSEWLKKSRAEFWSCVKQTPAGRRGGCHGRLSALTADRVDPVSVAMRSFVMPLVVLLGLISLLGGTLGMFLSYRVARGGMLAIRVARWTMGAAAAASGTLLVLGLMPETLTTAALAQSLCFAVLVSVRAPEPVKTALDPEEHTPLWKKASSQFRPAPARSAKAA
jgi:hypothetical protein